MDNDLEQGGFRQRLQLLMGEERPYAWAARLGINKGSFTNMWYRGGIPRASTAQKIVDATGCRLEWLLQGLGEPFPLAFSVAEPRPQIEQDSNCFVPENVLDEFCFIPRYNLKASAGFGTQAEQETPLFYMAFRKYWIKNYLNTSPHNLAVISVKGDSMSGVLEDRDTILINTADTTPSEGIYVIRMGDDIFVKQLQRLPGGAVQVRSSNPLYDAFTVDLVKNTGEFEVVGRVVWFGRQIS
ncbi:helix-turn-helix transcriptional regulator [Neisseriaceae bacterium TC5R-5]|nr:helix-turn-helix transcriptional regulator [Neisseriaceae bacterium TC5R-5]